MRAMLHEGVDAGGLGIGVSLDYFSEAVDRDELRMVFAVAGERKVPLFIHVRRGINGDPSGLREALELAEEMGAPVHICHLSHNAMRNTALVLAEIRAAREKGVDVTTEVLPYNAGSALISSAVFGRDWRTIFDIDYADVEWAATGERFTESMWEEYREDHPDGQVIHHYLEEDWTRTALVEPGVIVVSDLLPMVTRESKVAPHNGAFSRILGRYVREAGLIDLDTAIAKMTLLPARRLEKAFPEFKKKGRVQVGADADLTIFDPEHVLDRATYKNPYQTALGIEHVLVAGEVVVRDGLRIDGILPGRFLPLAPHP
jgi:N-acyl-D-aspartate/D-glutamate deacylase